MGDPVGISREQAAWSAADSLAYYSTHRRTPEDLYPSERFFLPDAAACAGTCLDIGCAAGGFSRIMKSFNPSLQYTGVDVTPALIRRAIAAFPDSTFLVGDGVNFATPPASYDLVYAGGILHLNSEYRAILRAAYAQTRHLLLCDFRLTWGPPVTGRFEVRFDEAVTEQRPDLPYLVLNVDDLLAELCGLEPAPRSVTLRGYYHAPARSADVPLPKVLMAFARIEKGPPAGSTAITVDLPREGD